MIARIKFENILPVKKPTDTVVRKDHIILL